MSLIQQRPKPTSFKPPTSPQAFVPGTNIPMSPGQGEFEALRKANLKKRGIFGEGVDQMFLAIDAFRLGGYDEEERKKLNNTLQSLILQGKINRKVADYFTDLFQTFPNPGETEREAIARAASNSMNAYGTASRLGDVMRMAGTGSTMSPPVNLLEGNPAFTPSKARSSPQPGDLMGTQPDLKAALLNRFAQSRGDQPRERVSPRPTRGAGPALSTVLNEEQLGLLGQMQAASDEAKETRRKIAEQERLRRMKEKGQRPFEFSQEFVDSFVDRIRKNTPVYNPGA